MCVIRGSGPRAEFWRMYDRKMTFGIKSLLLLLVACGAPSPRPHDEAGHTHDSTAAAVHESWQANPETNESIHAMEVLVDGYPANELSGVQLRDSLKERYAMIFERCTMTGPAHEALHDYLLPLNRMLRDLSDTPTPVELDSLKAHLHRYHLSFR